MCQKKTHLIAAISLLFLAASSLHASIIIDGYTDPTNDRFSNSSFFELDGFDLSGIGQDGSGKWATAISRNVVISAAHFSSTGTIYFYPGNDSTEAPVTRTVVSGTKIGSTDLYVSVLSASLPNSIKHYSFATEPLSGTPGTTPLTVANAGIYQGLNAYLFGRSPFDTESDPNREYYNDQAVGRNIVSGYSENVPFLGNTNADAILFTRDSMGDSNYVTYEAKFQSGDSGGPTFVDVSGELRLLGTNAFIYGSTEFEIGGNGSGINYTGNQAAFLNNFIAINAVPEPGSLILFALAMSICAIRRR